MTAVVVAVDEPLRAELAADLALEGADVLATMSPRDVADAIDGGDSAFAGVLGRADLLVLDVDGRILTAALVERCDRSGVRIVALCRTIDDERLAAHFGTTSLAPGDVGAVAILDAMRGALPLAAAARRRPGRVIAVWGPSGAPGRTTIAIEVAAELARRGRRVCLVDADSHAPAVALALGLPDEGPGLAGACRQAGLGGLDEAELIRVSATVDVGGARIDVLAGINRPSRWPELGADRLRAVLDACRAWADDVVVDVASSIEADEEIVSDLVDGPRRNAASRAVLAEADLVVAVAAADPLGMARFLRGHAELRSHLGAVGAAVRVVANRVRPGALGIDARGQIRRTLDRFAGIDAVWFLPHDPRSVDAAVLAARAVSAGSPRSPLVAAIRRFVGEAVERSGDAPSRPARPRRTARARIRSRADAA